MPDTKHEKDIFMEKSNLKKSSPKRSRDKIILSLLKKTGYLAPTTKREIEDFEIFFGNTEIELPEEINNPDFLFDKINDSSDEGKQELKPDKVNKGKTGSVDSGTSENSKTKKNDYFKKLVLAAEIANQLHVEPTFGHKKFVKVHYICEEVCNMQLSTNYRQYAAGPLDPKQMYSVDGAFKKRGWFNIIQRKGGYGYKYEPGENIEEYKKYYPRYYNNQLELIARIIELFRKKSSDFCEIVATMFFIWKKAALQNVDINDALLIKEFYSWGKEKKRFKEPELMDTLQWMRTEEIFPSLRF